MPSSILLKPVFWTYFLILFSIIDSSFGRTSHVITFRSKNLFPESLTWDPRDQHFLVGSLRRPAINSVSDAGVVNTLFRESPLLPQDSFILGLAVDRRNRRLLAVVHRRDASPPFSAALASFDLKSSTLVHLTPLVDEAENTKNTEKDNLNLIEQVTSDGGDNVGFIKQVIEPVGDSLRDGGGSETGFVAALANDVAVDFDGNAYVTSSLNDVIWKVNVDGEASVLSRSAKFKSYPIDQSLEYRRCGLNGVVYSSKGYLLVVQSNTGKLYKVDVDSGVTRRVLLNKDLVGADGMAMRRDGVVVVVSQEKLYFLKSADSWGEGVVFDETALDVEKQASGVVVGDEDRVYVLYGYVNQSMDENVEREEFSIVEIESEKEGKEDSVWVFVIMGLGLAYFMFWRFQMRHLVQSMNKKRA